MRISDQDRFGKIEASTEQNEDLKERKIIIASLGLQIGSLIFFLK